MNRERHERRRRRRKGGILGEIKYKSPLALRCFRGKEKERKKERERETIIRILFVCKHAQRTVEITPE